MIDLRRPDARFRPGEMVAGTARWTLDRAPQRVAVRLVYDGAGWQRRIVAELSVRNPPAEGAVDFDLTLPFEPYSFSGALVSVAWRVELVSVGRFRGRPIASAALMMSPSGDEIRLHDAAAPRWTPYSNRDTDPR